MSNTQSTSAPENPEFTRRVKAFCDATKIDFDVAAGKLMELGVDPADADCITIMDSDKFLTVSDIFGAFVDSGLAKIAKVRLGIPHLRGNTHTDDPQPVVDLATVITKLADANKKVEDMSVEELLSRYDEGNVSVCERLNKVTHGRPCIILNSDGTINKEESIKLAKTATKQPTSDRHMVGGKVVCVYRAGSEMQILPLDESPFYPTVILVNGICSKSTTDWNGIDHECRVIARIHVCEVENTKLSKMELKKICDDARIGVDHMRQVYSEAAMIYDKLKLTNMLPSLKTFSKDIKTSVNSLNIDKAF